jgi:hypothetical protein
MVIRPRSRFDRRRRRGREPAPRRGLGGAVPASALAVPPAEDPLLALERQWRAAEAEMEAMPGDIPDDHPCQDRLTAAVAGIAATPARTPDGVRVKVARLLAEDWDGHTVHFRQILESLLADLERWAGRRAGQA